MLSVLFPAVVSSDMVVSHFMALLAFVDNSDSDLLSAACMSWRVKAVTHTDGIKQNKTHTLYYTVNKRFRGRESQI